MYFPDMKKDPKYICLHAFSAIFFFLEFVTIIKNTLFSPNFGCFCTPKRCMYVRTLLNPEKLPKLHILFYKDDIHLEIQVAPQGIYPDFQDSFWFSCVFVSNQPVAKFRKLPEHLLLFCVIVVVWILEDQSSKITSHRYTLISQIFHDWFINT